MIQTNQESDSPHWRRARWLTQDKHRRMLEDLSSKGSGTHSKAESSGGSFSKVDLKSHTSGYPPSKKFNMLKEMQEIDNMHQLLHQAVCEKEQELEVEKADRSHTERRRKNPKEM